MVDSEELPELGKVYYWDTNWDSPRGTYVIPIRLESGLELYISITVTRLMKKTTKRYWTRLLRGRHYYGINIWRDEFDEDDTLAPILNNPDDRIDPELLTNIIFENKDMYGKLVRFFKVEVEQIKVDYGD